MNDDQGAAAVLFQSGVTCPRWNALDRAAKARALAPQFSDPRALAAAIDAVDAYCAGSGVAIRPAGEGAAPEGPGIDPGWTLANDRRFRYTIGGRSVVSTFWMLIPQLLAWIRMGRPDRALAQLGHSCATWRAQHPHARESILRAMLAQRTTFAGTDAALWDGTVNGGVSTLAQLDALIERGTREQFPYNENGIEAVLAGLDPYCGMRQYGSRAALVGAPPPKTVGLRTKLAPAGAAFTQAASYTNGPTLLAAAVAFAAGYAARRYLKR